MIGRRHRCRSKSLWCRRQESNLHGGFPPRDFKSHASTVPPRRHAWRTIGAAVVPLQASPDSLHILRGSRLTPLTPQDDRALCFSRHAEVQGAPSSGLPELGNSWCASRLKPTCVRRASKETVKRAGGTGERSPATCEAAEAVRAAGSTAKRQGDRRPDVFLQLALRVGDVAPHFRLPRRGVVHCANIRKIGAACGGFPV